MTDVAKNAALEQVYNESETLARHRNRDDKKCSIKEFTNRRREMLMLNMSINTRQEEIDKLHTAIEDRERALQIKEASLKETMQSYDCFLKEIDQQARKAARDLDAQLRIKTEKEQGLKELSQQIHVVSSGIRQQADTVDKIIRLKQLSLALTPEEWIEEFKTAKRTRQQDRRRRRIEKRKEEHRQQQEILLKRNNPTKSSRKIVRRQRPLEETPIGEMLPEPDYEDEQLTSSDEDCPIYFKDTHQLLEALSAVEDENVSMDRRVKELQSQS